MMSLGNELPSWTFFQEIEANETITAMLIDEEYVIKAFKTIRDIAVFTNKRLIVRDSQGITGKKVETFVIPYSSIYMYSTESNGPFLDFNSEVELWTKSGNIKINLKKGVDLSDIEHVLANTLL